MKLLTIVIPCYNVEAYLEKGLSTLSDVRFCQSLEVLIIDDGSTDATAEIALEYVKRCPEIFRLIQKENGGHGSTINEGIRQAKGKYFRILDGDDWVDTDNLAALLQALEKAHADLVVDKRCEVHMVTGHENHIPLPQVEIDGKPLMQNAVYPFEHICGIEGISRYFMIHNFSVKTELLRQNHIQVLENVFYEDSEYVLKATSVCKTAIFLDLEIYQYMIGNVNQSVSAENFVKRFDHFHKVTRAMISYTKHVDEKKEKRPVINGKQANGMQSADAQGDEAVRKYMWRRCRTVVLTEYYIALIYDTDRKRGRVRGKKFRMYLKKHAPQLAKETAFRYRFDVVLHFLGVDYHFLQLMRHALGKS